jgi:hypothetical protein
MLNADTAGAGVTVGQTLCQLWPIPDDVTAVGVIVLNDTGSPWSLARVIAAPSQTAYGQDGGLGAPASYLNPSLASGAAEWSNVTWRSRGRLDPNVVPDSDQCSFEVPSNTRPDPTLGLVGSPETSTNQVNAAPDSPAARLNVPNLFYSDLVPLRTRPAGAANGARYIMTRVLFDTTQPSPAVRGVFCHPRWLGSVQAAGWEWTTRASNVDIVSRPLAASTGQWTSFTPIVGITYLSRRLGALMVSSGDSHFDGTATSIAFGNFAFLTAKRVSRPGVCPVGYMNLAMGARGSNTFWPLLNRVVGALQPGLVLMESWTGNDDGASLQAEEKYWQRLTTTMRAVRSYGGVPVLVTPLPRDPKSMTMPMINGPWQEIRSRVLALGAAGEPVIDAGLAVGARAAHGLSGTYRTDVAVSPDTVHAGDLGHALIADAAVPVINKLLDR